MSAALAKTNEMNEESNYVGLIFKCPYDDTKCDCVFDSIRNEPTQHRYIKWNNLDYGIKQLLIQKHLNCRNKNEP